MPTNNPILDFGLTFIRDMLNRAVAPSAAAAPVPAGAKKARLEDIKLDDLKREKVRLEQEERKMLSDVRNLEGEKRKLFEEGVRNSSEREQRVMARRIKELDEQAKNADQNLQGISKQMRILNGLMQVKENVRLNTESGLASIISTIDLSDLINYVDRSSVDGEFQMNKFDDVLRAMEKSKAVTPQYSEDDDVLDIVKQMQMAREAADDPAAMEQHFSELNKKMVAKGKEAGEEEL